MSLSHELISQFAKVINGDKKQNTESTVYGTIQVDANGNKYVKLDGSDQLTPLAPENQPTVDDATATSKEGDRVTVLIKNHTATVTGNISSPSVNNDDVEQSINQFDIAIGEHLQANKGYFKDLTADKAEMGSLVAAIISVAELIATDARIAQLIADKITVDDLVATKIDTDIVIANNAIVENLKANNVDILSLIADKAVMEELIANDADINSLEAKNAYLKYVTIDFSNIGEAAMKKFYADSGLIKDVVISDGNITGHLVGVTITGDLIEANTLVADKLVILGDDGLYYKLNMNGETVETEQTDRNSLNGKIITAKSITAEKIRVDDLVAFDATIGGFKIDENAIYSNGKGSIDSNNPGVYLDRDGQIAFGDHQNFFKYYKDENGAFKLAVEAERIVFGAGKTFILDSDGITVEGKRADTNIDIKTTVSNNGMTVYGNNDEVLKANDEGVVAKDLHAKSWLIVGDNSRFENYGDNKDRTACFWIGG